MSFHRAERLVTAFLCISGAAESCVLPFLCLHLTQLGVPPLQTGLAVSALLLLRGLSGALWWRSLRAGRRTGRRRLAAAAGALVSAAVICALAALPPSIGCGAGSEGVVGTGLASVPPLEGVPVPPHNPQTDSAASSVPPGWSPPGEGQLTTIEGVSGGQRPPPGGGGGGGRLRPPTVSSGGGEGLPVTSDASHPHRPTSSETDEQQRPGTGETSWEHRPATSETNSNHRPESSESNSNHRPETSEVSETDVSHRPSTSSASSASHDQKKTKRIRPTDQNKAKPTNKSTDRR